MPEQERARLYVRADGNSAVGSGHLMRCLSVADALRELGADTVFITAGPEGRGLIGSRGYENKVLATDYRRPEEELETLKAYLEEEKAGLLLADSYFITPAWLSALRPLVKTAFMDDSGERAWDADLVINYNIYADRLPYGRLYPAGSRTALLLGSRFAPLRRDFAGRGCLTDREPEDILVTTGGADGCRAAGRIAELIRGISGELGKNLNVHVISGPFHEFRDELYAMREKDGHIYIHENVTDMAGLMASCGLAVSAAGSTLYELCAVGVPAVYFYFVENQELPAKYFELDTGMRNAGNFAKDPEGALKKIEECLRELLSSQRRREEVSRSMRRVSDGRGAERIAECLKGLLY